MSDLEYALSILYSRNGEFHRSLVLSVEDYLVALLVFKVLGELLGNNDLVIAELQLGAYKTHILCVLPLNGEHRYGFSADIAVIR